MTEKKKHLVPRLRFPEFRNAGPWEVKRLGEVADVIAAGDLDQEDFSSERTGDYIFPIFSNSVAERGLYGFCANPKFEKNSVTVTARGTLGVAFYRDVEFSAIGRLLVLRNLKDILPYFLQETWNHSVKLAHENGGIPQLTAIMAKPAKLAVPSLPEQQKIADCLSSLDEVIELQARKLDALKAHKRGLMQQLFPREGETTPRLRFPEFRNAGPWEVKRLGEVCDVLDNMRRPVNSTNRKAGPYPYYGASGVIDYIDEYIFDERLLLIGEDGAKWGPFERTAFIVEGKCWVNNHAHVLRSVGISDVLLENYLNAVDLSCYITGAAPPKLTLEKLKSIRIPVPKQREEQQKIADCLSSLDEVIELEARKLEALKAHKKGLLQQLFPQEVTP